MLQYFILKRITFTGTRNMRRNGKKKKRGGSNDKLVVTK